MMLNKIASLSRLDPEGLLIPKTLSVGLRTSRTLGCSVYLSAAKLREHTARAPRMSLAAEFCSKRNVMSSLMGIQTQ